MRAEYKRDMNHNYLVLYGEEEIDTSAYQVRMLVGNVIPSLLKCRIQGMDGNFVVYYDITSRQSLVTFYEDRKLGHEDLKLIFGEFIRVMEDAAEYLMNPGQLVIMPEYMFLEVEKKEIYFCLMPGYQRDVREQFQALTEYILPKIDHKDEAAVMIGYGVYRRALEDSFHLEHIKEELYRARDSENRKRPVEIPLSEEKQDFFERENAEKDIFAGTEFTMSAGDEKTKPSIWKKVIGFGAGILVLAAVMLAKVFGYLPNIEVATILGVVLAVMGVGMLVYIVMKKKKEISLNNRNKESDFYRNTENRESIKLTEERFSDKIFSEQTERKEERRQDRRQEFVENCGETVVLSLNPAAGPSSLVSREPGELATIYLGEELTIIGKLKTASDAVIDLPTVSRVHAKIRKRGEGYYLTDLNSRNGTSVNGRLLKADEEYLLQNEDEVDFAQARYVFLQ